MVGTHSHIPREQAALLKHYAQQFRAVMLLGPRQSGKSTLVRAVFPDKPYASLENPDEQLLAERDAKAFLGRFPHGAVLDEVQRTPILLNYLQGILDSSDRDGLFILTGSNNILLQENVSQTLAGRVGVLDLLPLSVRELDAVGRSPGVNDLILLGFYPEVHAKGRDPQAWYNAYLRTYVERDVRQIKNIAETMLFTRFVQLCAGRIGQALNVAALSNACGIDVRTVNAWLSVLEQTYVIKLLQPYHRNFNKRITKAPKLYFVDTGLACALLGIRNASELELSHFRGALFENLVILEMMKNDLNQGARQRFHYWRDNKGVEVDLIVDQGASSWPMEIKSARTWTPDFAVNLVRFMSLSEDSHGSVVYDGDQEFTTTDGVRVSNWRSVLCEHQRPA